MNLADILLPKLNNGTYPLAESADYADNQQPRSSQSPQWLAENSGKRTGEGVNPHNPQVLADSKDPAGSAFPRNPRNPHDHFINIEKPLALTIEYFQECGVTLLPDDIAFMRWNLPLDTGKRNGLMQEYIRIWVEAHGREPISYRKDNYARLSANSWLREVLK